MSSPEERKEQGESPECLQLSSPTLKSIEDDDDRAKKEENKADAKGDAKVVVVRKIKKRGASPEEGAASADGAAASKRKKSWSNLKTGAGGEEDVVSSDSLKDMVASVSTILERNGGDEVELEANEDELQEETRREEEEETGGGGGTVDTEGKKVEPRVEQAEEDDGAEDGGAFVKVEDLVRPFTINQLKELLSRTGEIDDQAGFFINKIKSVCVVRYLKSSGARETVSSLDNVRWPSTNPKTLRVTLTDEEEFQRLFADGGAAPVARPPPVAKSDRGHSDAGKGTDRAGRTDGIKEETRGSAKEAPKPLEELFRSTKTTPLLYWKTAV